MSVLPQPIISNLVLPQATSNLTDIWLSLTFWFARLDPKDTDVIAQFQESFNHFVKSGQAWALVIGLVIGYLFKSFTSY